MIAGYLSANRIDLARVSKTAKTIRLEKEVRLVTRDYSNIESALAQFIKNQKVTDLDKLCLGVAGPVIGGAVRPTNLPWQIDESSLRERFGFEKVRLVNDVVATAHGLVHLGDDKFFEINAGTEVPGRNIGLIAAGSGLGAAIIFVTEGVTAPHASEGGHATYSPGNQIESELFEYVYADKGYVEAEDVISWVGLERIYNFLTDTQGYRRGDWFDAAEYRAAAVIEKALSGADDAATHTLDIFIDCYATATANLALTGMTLGGMYVGGQIAPRIITALEKGRFVERFVKKGKMETLLSNIPIGLIIEDRAALIGAAAIVRDL
jgi:glucokinase